MRNISSLQAEKNKLIADATTLVQRGLKTEADKEQHRQLLVSIDIIQSDLDALTHIERSLPQQTQASDAVASSQSVSLLLTPEQRHSRKTTAYRHFLWNGYQPGSVEQRDLTVAADGSVLAAQDWEPQWTDALKHWGPVGTLIRLITKDNGSPTKISLSDNTQMGMSYLAETGSVDALEADESVSSLIPSTDTLVSFTKASVQMLTDAGVTGGLEGFIRDSLFSVAARSLEKAILAGTDSTGTTLPNSYSGGLVGSTPQGAVTPSLASGIGFDQLIALMSSVDVAYRQSPNAAFMADVTVHDWLAAQMDSTGRPFYKYDDEGYLLIAGKRLYIAGSGMPQFGTVSSKAVLFGDFSRCYAAVLRPVQLRVLRERFMADSLQVGFVSHMRVGGQPLINDAVKALVTAAS